MTEIRVSYPMTAGDGRQVRAPILITTMHLLDRETAEHVWIAQAGDVILRGRDGLPRRFTCEAAAQDAARAFLEMLFPEPGQLEGQ